MANRPLAQRTVTDIVLPDEHKADMWQAGANLAEGLLGLKRKADIAKTNDFIADANIQAMKVTNDWRIANEADPFNKEAVQSLNESYGKIFSLYDDKVGFLSRAQWQQNVAKITKQWQAENVEWGTKRSFKNYEIQVNSTIKKENGIAYELGRTGDWNKANTTFSDAAERLRQSSSGVIGDVDQEKLIKDFRADYMKSFVMGKAYEDPDGAIKMLEDEKAAEIIGDPENVKLLKNLAQKQKTLNERNARSVEIITYKEWRKKILTEDISFNDIDNNVANPDDAFKLKQFMVRVDNAKSDPIKTARYLTELANLPIDSQKEADKIYDMVMNDKSLSSKDKKTILTTDIYGGDEKVTMMDLAGGQAEFPGRSQGLAGNWRPGPLLNTFMAIKNKLGDSDAIEAFESFQKEMAANDDPFMMKQKANRAVSEVVTRNNPALAEIGTEWVEIKDAYGATGMARRLADGTLEVIEAGYEEEGVPEEEEVIE